jgi:alcohol dehydrogenase
LTAASDRCKPARGKHESESQNKNTKQNEEEMSTTFGVMRSPQIVLFGSGQRLALTRLAGQYGRRAFICSDNRFMQDAVLSDMMTRLQQAGMEVMLYDGTIAELPLECIEAATQQARGFGPDVVIGIGGGSCMDIAKLVAVGLSHDAPLSDFYGEFKVPGPVVPVIAITTTAGTGSEVTPVAVLADPQRAMKVGISSPYLIPAVAICDPDLTGSCPPALTAIAGADALTHAIESFTAIRREPSPDLALNQVFVGKNVFSDAQARIAIQALARHLPAAVKSGADAKAREQVMLGAMSAGIAFGCAGTAAAHALQYPVGALTHTAHGLGVAALMPYVMAFNLPNCVPEFCEIASMFGQDKGGASDEAFARRGIEAVDAMFRLIGIPRTLPELGLKPEQKDLVAEQSLLAARLVNNNPRLLDRAAMDRIVSSAFSGDRALYD